MTKLTATPLALETLRADTREKAENGDLLAALDSWRKAVVIAAELDEKAVAEDLAYLSKHCPEAQWEAIQKALRFGWTFGVHYGDGSVEMDRGKNRMVIQEDGTYTR